MSSYVCMLEPTGRSEALYGSSVHHEGHETGQEAGPGVREDGGGLLGTFPEAARGPEVPGLIEDV